MPENWVKKGESSSTGKFENEKDEQNSLYKKCNQNQRLPYTKQTKQTKKEARL
jgi:hypothetical protein